MEYKVVEFERDQGKWWISVSGLLVRSLEDHLNLLTEDGWLLSHMATAAEGVRLTCVLLRMKPFQPDPFKP